MSKESDFHKLIESQDTESKEEVWKKLESRLTEESSDIVVGGGEVGILAKKLSRRARNIIISVAACLLVAGLVLFIIFNPFRNTLPNIRYCTVNDYRIYEVEITIKDYAIENSPKILYFDDYTEFEYCVDKQYKLKDTNEIIGLHEELYSLNGAFINIYVTDNLTDLDAAHSTLDNCKTNTNVKGIAVKWGNYSINSYAHFEYDGYLYYLSADYPEDNEYVLKLVEELLS